ncbi:MbnP family protein [Mesonia sp. K7]|uniref:MbnP family protein n=1 Tax=Mesonia sp. K7 TaxID=2218606 RepID=UPI000DA828D8|nr:MbnP family protein [Mesonia sp. K7]PZD78447.1 hypothetical protein DNG35_05135 [Mesonia sp. K7]
MKKFFLPLFLVSTLLMSCFEDNDDLTINTPTQGETELQLQFHNQIGNQEVEIDDEPIYINEQEETYSINFLKYIISNIVLIDENGMEYAYPEAESYFLINQEEESSKNINLDGIPTKKYSAIRFGIGVDQSNYPLEGVDNFVPTAQENEMLWSWSAGYIFLKMEGFYNSTQANNEVYRYHIGSHGEALDNYREVTLAFAELLDLTHEDTTIPMALSITSDISLIFDGENNMSLDAKSDIQMDPENAPKVIENFSKSFSVSQ